MRKQRKSTISLFCRILTCCTSDVPKVNSESFTQCQLLKKTQLRAHRTNSASSKKRALYEKYLLRQSSFAQLHEVLRILEYVHTIDNHLSPETNLVKKCPPKEPTTYSEKKEDFENNFDFTLACRAIFFKRIQ